MKHYKRLLAAAALIAFGCVTTVYSAERQIKMKKQTEIQQQELSPGAQSHDPHWRPRPSRPGIDLVVSQVRITRYADRGKIGIHVRVKNTRDGHTSDLIRVKFSGWPGNPHVWIHGGISAGETKGIGLVTDDNAERNLAIGPVTVEVNPAGEIAETNTGNNTCSGAELLATQNRRTKRCH